MHLISKFLWFVVTVVVVQGNTTTIKSYSNMFTKEVRTSFPPTLLDTLRERYFSIEDALWHAINSGMDRNYALQQIHSGHLALLRDNFNEKSCYFSTFDPEEGALFETIQQINQSVSTTVTNYLHSNRRQFNEPESLLISGKNLNLTYHLDKIYELTGIKEFYFTVRNVSTIETQYLKHILNSCQRTPSIQ